MHGSEGGGAGVTTGSPYPYNRTWELWRGRPARDMGLRQLLLSGRAHRYLPWSQIMRGGCGPHSDPPRGFSVLVVRLVL